MPELPIKKPETDKISLGAYKDVHHHPDNKDLVVKTQREKIEDTPEMKEKWHLLAGMEFYLTKILHTIAPEHIPNIHMASTQDETFQTMHDRVANVSTLFAERTRLNKLLRKIRYTIFQLFPNEKAISIKHDMAGMGVKIDARNPANFGTAEDGTYQYIDSPSWSDKNESGSIKYIVDTDIALLEKAIKQLPESKKRICTSYLERFKFLLRIFQENHIDKSE